MFDVSYKIARAAMKTLADGGVHPDFQSLGISVEDMEKTCGEEPWLGKDRARVTAVLDAVTFSVMDVLGIPRFTVPAEYRASIIAMFVSPANIMIACRWLESGPTAEDMASGIPENQLETVPARQLFALVLGMQADGEVYFEQWEKQVNLSIRRSRPVEDE